MPGNALGEFLRARRARVSPEAAGVPTIGARRVPGLRREEVATMAGVSADYYVRLEQGARAAPVRAGPRGARRRAAARRRRPRPPVPGGGPGSPTCAARRPPSGSTRSCCG
ncbi:helix-turn-helix transcriptional regulator [Nocardioides sp. TF02-7]|uniref:helix-turn-helix domain-containing protein n=1 Tax=Nocardioides sp. TF02-7 TaxID=2917724 RepID=UPI001F056CB5|nr:helix-turn-helix transcriptional regulator [Nocardioides sp. TF02-7]UMG93958.1 helix-turn-helix domain-containing protein [Nocardioides sp. TF02-7]